MPATPLSAFERGWIISTASDEDHPSAGPVPGFCGKLPTHGDFVSRRIPAPLRGAWEKWLDTGVSRSRQMLGDRWLHAYLSSPIWRFSISEGCCGDQPFAGVLMPSLDRVGRYYPLSIIAVLESEYSAAGVVAGAKDWFSRIETIALSCLTDDFDFDRFDGDVAAETFRVRDREASVPSSPPDQPTAQLAARLGDLLRRSDVPYGIWWTSGSKDVPACCRVFPRLPPPEEFGRFLA